MRADLTAAPASPQAGKPDLQSKAFCRENSVPVAITREVSPNIGRCELTHLPRRVIDFSIAKRQHRQYEECLTDLAYSILRLPTASELPDAVFVEDTCVVLDELAIIARPGAESRRVESHAISEAMKTFRELRFITSPGTLDGGDVLRLGRHLFVGQSSRTNSAGIDQLRALTAPFGYTVVAVILGRVAGNNLPSPPGIPRRDGGRNPAARLTGCLHLKSAVTQVGRNVILVNRSWVEPRVFGDVEVIDVDPAEPMAANALLVCDTVVYPAAFPATRKRLEEKGIRVRATDISELAKAEGGVTCCSLLVGPASS
jgi:dimethylargininase